MKKKNNLLQMLAFAAAGMLWEVKNAIVKEVGEDLVPSTAAEGVAISSAGAALASVSAIPYQYVVSADCPDNYRRVVRPGYPGVIELKLHTTAGNIVAGSKLQLHSDGTSKLDLGTGARVIHAIALEAKTAEGQLLKARVLPYPEVFAS